MERFPMTTEYAPYAGIGSRETPKEILDLMTGIALMLDERGYVLRSGGAEGADRAFDRGTSAMSHPEIYLPWDGFNGQKDHLKIPLGRLNEAMEIARRFHPNWEACSSGARKLHTRNTFQILGVRLDNPCKFVICWTKEGKMVGGTSQALRIAEAYKVPIYNLANEEHREIFYHQLEWRH